MIGHHENIISAVFITFSGNCKEALAFYQTCFGGELSFTTFGKELQGYTGDLPVISGSLVSDRIVIYASDLVHSEGRKLGNYISIYLKCKDSGDRKELIKKLASDKQNPAVFNDDEQQLMEITDAYEVRWVLGI